MLILLITPLIGIQSTIWLTPWSIASAATTCETTSDEPVWGVEAQNITMYNYMYWGDGIYDEYGEYDGGHRSSEDIKGMAPPQIDPKLGSLTEDDDFSVTQSLENDSATGLRLNLTVGQKYTFCITAQNVNNETVLGKGEVDIYLMTKDDWERYEWDYSERHQDWRQFFSDIPPEWRSTVDAYTFWMPFRDVHAYEKVSEQQFSVALDHNEIDTGDIWGPERNGIKYDNFYLVIDAWDNGRENDAKPSGNNISVDISVVVDSRVSLWNWTVSLVCGGMLLGIAAIPIIINMRYKKKGMDDGRVDLMPSLENTSRE